MNESRDELERKAVDAVAEWLAAREGSQAFTGRGFLRERSAYRSRAAALLNGEKWAQLDNAMKAFR